MTNKICTLIVLILTVSCFPSGKAKNLAELSLKKIGVLPDKMPGFENDAPAVVSLGRKLFFEPRLSINDNLSCNTCHNVLNKKAGVDNLPKSPGSFGKTLERNTPTILNAGFSRVGFYWDGRFSSLEEQVRHPILDPLRMAIPDAKYLTDKLASIKEYKDSFDKTFTDNPRITIENVSFALAAYQRTLKTNDRFDDFQRGNLKALSIDERKGLELFLNIGCTNCHNGPLLGGSSYQKMGAVNPYPTQDIGRFKITGDEKDKFSFKVPTLRNIALTAPYFHDGSIRTLDVAVKKMAWHQLGKNLTEQEIESIVIFLNSLTDKPREN